MGVFGAIRESRLACYRITPMHAENTDRRNVHMSAEATPLPPSQGLEQPQARRRIKEPALATTHVDSDDQSCAIGTH